jgi:hypothetical protein
MVGSIRTWSSSARGTGPSAFVILPSWVGDAGPRTSPPIVVCDSTVRPEERRHLPQCEYVGETDVGVLKVLLKVMNKGDCDWVECGACGAGWQAPHYPVA